VAVVDAPAAAAADAPAVDGADSIQNGNQAHDPERTEYYETHAATIWFDYFRSGFSDRQSGVASQFRHGCEFR
jgi:hypothetical protein